MKFTKATENAWMIRNDGKEFKMLQHVYGSKEEIEETLAAAEWLYDATAKTQTRNSIVDFIATWGYSLNATSDVIETIHAAIDSKPYKFLTHEFVNSIADKIRSGNVMDDLIALNVHIVDELNQEFLRARYGGMYNTSVGSKEMVFRVSSIHFNWFNIIFNFVYERKNQISTVTIVKDEESTGFDDVYTHNGVKLYQLPIDDFIMLPGNPVVETLEECTITKLLNGNSIRESLGVKMNMRRLNARWIREKFNFLKNTTEI